MIFDVIIISGLSVLNLLGSLFGLLKFAIPNQVESSIEYVMSYLAYFQGIAPMDQVLDAIGFYLVFLTLYYTVKIILWGISHIPWLGKHTTVPKVGDNERKFVH